MAWRVLSLVVLLAGCETNSARYKDCDKEYAATLPHCAPVVRSRPATPEECEKLGGIQVYVDGDYKGCERRDGIRDLLNGRR